MNIFVTSPDPYQCAEFLDNKRVIKMTLESAQLLSNAVTLNGRDGWYELTHPDHPCTLWTQATRENYEWLLEHFKALCSVYADRFDKQHKCASLLNEAERRTLCIPDGPLLEFENCTPYKELPVYEAYTRILLDKWTNDKRAPRWHAAALLKAAKPNRGPRACDFACKIFSSPAT